MGRQIRPILMWAVMAVACSPGPQPGRPLAPGVVEFANEMGTVLKADYAPAQAGRPVLVLMHGLGAGRGEWKPWTSSLTARGYGVFAFDARGHGESGGADFKTFQSAAAWRAVAGDFHAAKDFLYRGGVARGRLVFGGSGQLWRAAAFALCGAVIVLSYFWNETRERGDYIADLAIGEITSVQLEQMLGPGFKDFLFDPTSERIALSPNGPGARGKAVVMVSADGTQGFLVFDGLPMTNSQSYTVSVTL